MSVRPIILVEDNEKLRRLYVEMLEGVGFAVMATADGEKAIALLHRVANPQLVILDIMMPRMNGIEACSRIRKMQRAEDYPIIFLTALDRPETLLECLRAGGDDYLMKSAPVTEMLERVRYWSHKGAVENIAERRKRAIVELERIVAEMDAGDLSRASADSSGEQANLKMLAQFLTTSASGPGAEKEALFRFGYLVGLVEGCLPSAESNGAASRRFLRSLMLRTDFIDRDEIGPLFDNLERVMTQGQFREGWTRGYDDAATVGAPQQARLVARLGED